MKQINNIYNVIARDCNSRQIGKMKRSRIIIFCWSTAVYAMSWNYALDFILL